jgi:hypothetical protein
LRGEEVPGMPLFTAKSAHEGLSVVVGSVNGEHQVKVHGYHPEDWRGQELAGIRRMTLPPS